MAGQIDAVRETNYSHSVLGDGAAGHDRLFFIAVLQPDLAVEAVAVPAEIAVRDRFHRQELKATQQRIVFGHQSPLAEDLDLDEAFVGLKDVIRCHEQAFG